ncbi:MAG: hypothetical protein Q8P56_04280 [Candidatus Uhrbacteria bacterium]|nr:hypothetical protein [Candidatus Uhrbacteria bacterium]
MLFSKSQTVKDRVVEALGSGPIRITVLIEYLSKHGEPVSKQGIYGALRELARDEVVVVYKKQVSLNHAWLMRLADFSGIAHQRYFEHEKPTSHFKDLKPNQRTRLTFKNLSLLDAFWGHVLYTLIENNPTHEPLLMYNPHWWFAYSRNPSEIAILDFCKRQNTPLLETIGHNTPIDRSTAKFMDGVHAQYHVRTKPLFKKDNYYINVLGEFIIDVWIDKDLHAVIEKLYHEETHVTKEWIDRLEALNTIKGKSMLVVSRNPKRANELRKKLLRPFTIPKHSYTTSS